MHSDLVLDAAAFYAGTVFQSSSGRMYTTTQVLREVQHIKRSFSAVEILQESGRLVVLDPEDNQLAQVRGAAEQTGDITALSQADLSIVALALQLGCTLVTDDYSIANVSSVLNVPVRPATAGKSIRQAVRWIFYCSGCGRTFQTGQVCPLCGNKLKRKPKKLRA